MEITVMTDAHVPQIAALEVLCFHDPWDVGSIASELTNPLSLWLVAMEGDAVVGYIGSQTVLDESDMMNVAVHPDFRRRGIAEALVLTLAAKLKEKGSTCLALEVRVSNAPAVALYEKLGFTQAGLRRNYYRNPKEDAYILKKAL